MNSNMNAVVNSKVEFPCLIMGARMHVYSNGSYFTQNKALKLINNNVINIYIVYKLNP